MTTKNILTPEQSKDKVFRAMKEKWYVQGFIGTPLLLIPTATSGFDLDPILQDHYRHYIYEYHEEYGKMYYSVEDLNRLAQKIIVLLRDNKKFLPEAQKKYQKELAWVREQIIPLSNPLLSSCTENELIPLLQKAQELLRTSAGFAHMIEAFSLTTDVIIKEKLSKYICDPKQLNEYLSILSAPTTKSFLNEREQDLLDISLIKNKKEKVQKIQEHLEQFFWIRNTYAGRVQITPKEIEEELKTISVQDYDSNLKHKKEEIIKSLKLDAELVMLLSASEFMTDWQDERKKNILIAIDYMDQLLEEVSRRNKIDIAFLRYLTTPEMDVGFLFKNIDTKSILTQRRKGMICYNYFDGKDEDLIILTGDDFLKIHKYMGTFEKEQKQIREFNGLSASTGTVVGKVKVCKSLQDINKVQEGDILVASMTRPEYLPAMKKAAAFITDEGGITCHAAIIAREMKKPCIIGTKIATQVLKDGDMVEVKADHGLVIILK